MAARLKLNEIRSEIEMGNLIKRDQLKVQGSIFRKVAKEVLQWDVLQWLQKLSTNAKNTIKVFFFVAIEEDD